MLTRIEIAAGIIAAAVVFILAGYAVVSGILIVHPDPEVRECVARAEASGNQHTHSAELKATEACTQLIRGKHSIP